MCHHLSSDTNYRIFCFGTTILFCFLIFISINHHFTEDNDTGHRCHQTEQDEKGNARKAPFSGKQIKIWSNKYCSLSKHQSNHNFILDIFAQSFRQGGECIVELFLIHRIAWWGAMMAPLRKNALDPARFCHCHLTLKNLQNQSSLWRLDKASCLSIRRVIWILASDTDISSVAEVMRRHEGPLPKSLDLDENFKPKHTLFFQNNLSLSNSTNIHKYLNSNAV